MLRKYPILGYLRKQMIFDFGIRIGYKLCHQFILLNINWL